MNSNNFISINKIISDIYYDSTMADCPIDFIIDKSIELMGVCGIPNAFENKEAIIDVSRYRAQVPCDLFEVNQVRVLQPDSDQVDENHDALVYSTDTFEPNHSQQNTLTYKVHGGLITLSIPTCRILMSYTAFATDENGYPMIVDNQAFIRALESYIVLKWSEILVRQGKLDANLLSYSANEYQWNVGNAMTNLATPTVDQMESIARFMNSSIKVNDHGNGFKNTNNFNHIKLH